ncbi:MAG: sigma-54-dependent Fis family transcriptional regulator [bacterium]|nr:MAG: sigma-54-dependent Fis family transcriptional regulator [bacterium]
MSKVLIIDDEAKIAALLSERISREGFEVSTLSSAEEALPQIDAGGIDIILCDLKLGGMDGLELLRRTKRISPATDFVMMTAYASSKTAVEAMREGAYEYLIKPFQMDEVLLLLKQIQERRDLMTENLLLRERIAEEEAARRIVGESSETSRIREMIQMVAPTDTPVLIQGESGTGKELVAADIHERSARRRKPFVVINCAAVPETLLEAELFGYEKGAFTGAAQRKPGQFKLADSGTLFLDEIGELPLGLQAKLLRAIENGEFLPLGSSKSVTVDVRVIAATNRNLEELTREGHFREDLFYRLNVFPITIPPLRKRKGDIVPIAEHFFKHWKISPDMLRPAAVEKLMGYSWPGNVRELRNILERAIILAGSNAITDEHIAISDAPAAASPEERLGSLIGERTLPEIEKTLIELALKRAGGNKSKAAGLLGITRRTLYGHLKRYAVEGSDGDQDG